jgi:hypothetical protein
MSKFQKVQLTYTVRFKGKFIQYTCSFDDSKSLSRFKKDIRNEYNFVRIDSEKTIGKKALINII